MRGRSFAVAAIGCGLLLLSAGPPPATDDRIAFFHADPKKHDIRLHWKDPQGRVLGDLGRLITQEETAGRKLLCAMNGGMFDAHQAPVGLYVENGKELHAINTVTKGYGNFHLMPNGVFGIAGNDSAYVCTTPDQAKVRNVRYATQSGPMLLVNGNINSAFREGSANLNIRNGVGVRKDGTVLFAVSKEPVNFFDFARFFRDQGCLNALYLDGAISRTYLPGQGLDQRDGRLGVLIGISER
ncbi:MAG TPA: phosphodiester glycosidase family protein [Flavobacteriales bacterium]